MTKKELEFANTKLDETCQALQYDLEGSRKEAEILKGIISLMLESDEILTKMIKVKEPNPLHIKIDNDMCTITRGYTDAVM